MHNAHFDADHPALNSLVRDITPTSVFMQHHHSDVRSSLRALHWQSSLLEDATFSFHAIELNLHPPSSRPIAAEFYE
jgi:hypothetical protein